MSKIWGWVKGHKVLAFMVLFPILAGVVDYTIGLRGFPLTRLTGSIVTVVLLLKILSWFCKGVKCGFSKLGTLNPKIQERR